jgi:SAM-dependent methyltransferase
MTTYLADAITMWTAGMRVGLATMRRGPALGLKRIVLPVSYWRTAEFAYVWRHLMLPAGARVLDLGSPKDLALILARERGLAVTATDILPEAVHLCDQYATAQGIAGQGAGQVHAVVQDGRALSYPDDTFDAAYSVSVVEHIPDRGDAAAMAELVRVVKPGGVIVVTTPYDTTYRETFVDGPVYERREATRNFFERHYDDAALADRLLSAPGAELIDREIWGERWMRTERLLSRLGPLRIPLSPFEAFLAAASLRHLEPGARGRPMAVFFTVRKSANAS